MCLVLAELYLSLLLFPTKVFTHYQTGMVLVLTAGKSCVLSYATLFIMLLATPTLVDAAVFCIGRIAACDPMFAVMY